MKCNFSSMWRVAVALVLALSVSLMTAVPVMADSPASVDLGSAANFAVLAGTGITNTGANTITGDIGTYPTTTETLGSLTLHGIDHAGDVTTQAAKTDLTTAYDYAADAARAPATVATELGSTSPVPGVYKSVAGTFEITGTLTLTGNATDVWIFQTNSTLITADGSQVILSGGAKASNVFWQVGSSATLGANSVFRGNILALTSITINTGAIVYGRALARNGAVTSAASIISVPPTWESYSDSGHIVACDSFADLGSEHTVYMYGTGFDYNHSYRVAYYDGGNSKRYTEDVTSGASGNVSSQRTFAAGTDVAGTWYAIVCEPADTPPSEYGSGWASTIVTDTFVVLSEAIPEFPTVVAVIVVLSLCLVMYLWMRRRAIKAYA